MNVNVFKGNLIDYNKINRRAKIKESGHFDISVIVPVRGRTEFNRKLYESINSSADFAGIRCGVTFVEHSNSPSHEKITESNYIYLETKGVFNKCLSFNIGFIDSIRADYYLFHDLDCIVRKEFMRDLMENMNNSQYRSLQSFRDRRVSYCDEETTKNILSGKIKIDELNSNHTGVTIPPKESWKAPGGSIFCTRDHFVDVGGYDPDLFWGYSPEDAFFYDKLSNTGGVGSCNNPNIDIFHLYHPPLWNSNPDLPKLNALQSKWMALPLNKKIETIEYRSRHLKKYI